MRRFTFYNPSKLLFGEGSVAKAVGKELNALGARRPLLVTDVTISSVAAVFSGVVPDTGINIIAEAVQLARQENADSVVSVGGGSSIELRRQR